MEWGRVPHVPPWVATDADHRARYAGGLTGTFCWVRHALTVADVHAQADLEGTESFMRATKSSSARSSQRAARTPHAELTPRDWPKLLARPSNAVSMSPNNTVANGRTPTSATVDSRLPTAAPERDGPTAPTSRSRHDEGVLPQWTTGDRDGVGGSASTESSGADSEVETDAQLREWAAASGYALPMLDAAPPPGRATARRVARRHRNGSAGRSPAVPSPHPGADQRSALVARRRAGADFNASAAELDVSGPSAGHSPGAPQTAATVPAPTVAPSSQPRDQHQARTEVCRDAAHQLATESLQWAVQAVARVGQTGAGAAAPVLAQPGTQRRQHRPPAAVPHHTPEHHVPAGTPQGSSVDATTPPGSFPGWIIDNALPTPERRVKVRHSRTRRRRGNSRRAGSRSSAVRMRSKRSKEARVKKVATRRRRFSA